MFYYGMSPKQILLSTVVIGILVLVGYVIEKYTKKAE